MNVIERMIQRDPSLSEKLIWGGPYLEYRQAEWPESENPTGIALEEGEFLYGLIRLVRPLNILETGTNLGISTRFMALALEDNKAGRIYTIEQNRTIYETAVRKTDAYKNVTCLFGPVETTLLPENVTFDFMFLDTELAIRLGELERFIPLLAPGGFIMVNDLFDMSDVRFGGVSDQLKDWIKSGLMRAVSLFNVHGDTLFQKRFDKDHLADIQGGLA
jgi:predicted O-methyltransferase YrrM